MQWKIISYSLFFLLFYVVESREKDTTIEFHKNIILNTKNDSLRLEHLIHLSWDYRNYNTDSAISYSDQSILLANKLENERLLSKELDIRSEIYLIANLLDSAEYYQLKSIRIRKKNNDHRGLRSSYSVMGDIERKKGHYDLSLRYYFKALNEIDSIKYDKVEYELIDRKKFNNLDSLIQFYLDDVFGIAMYRRVGGAVKFVHLANTKRLIGEVYLLKNNFPESKKYLLDALELNYRLGDGDQIVPNENSLAELNIKEGNYDRAIDRLNRAIYIGKEITNYSEVANSFSLLSEIYRLKKNYSKSLSFLDSIKHYNRKYSAHKSINYLLIKQLAILCDSMEVDKSENLVNQSAAIVEDIRNTNLIETISKSELLELYYAMFLYFQSVDVIDSAIVYQTKFYNLKDTIIGLESQNRLTELFKIYENEKKIELIKNQEKQILNYEDLLLIAAIFLFIIITITAFVIINNKKMKRLNQNISNLNIQLRESTKNKEQLFTFIAHDLRGPPITSNSVLSMLITEELTSERKHHYLTMLQETLQKSEMFTENLMHWTKSKSGTIKPNITQISINSIIEETLSNYKLYIDNKHLQIKKQLEDVSYESDKILLTAIINNLLQNAFRHSPNGSAIIIVLQATVENWELTIRNDGAMEQTTIENFNNGDINHSEKGNGLGLVIVKNYSILIDLDCKITTASNATTFVLKPI